MSTVIRISISLLGTLALILNLSHRAYAEDRMPFPDIQRIMDAGVIRVAILAKDAPPLIVTDLNGQLTGNEPDLARDLAKKLGVGIEFIRSAETYDDVVQQVARKEADIAVSYLTGGVQRAMYVGFSDSYIHQAGRYFYNRARFAQLKRDYSIDDLEAINGIPAQAGLSVGVVKGTVYQSQLKDELPPELIKTYANLDEIMAAVRSGEIFAGIHGSLQTQYFMREHSELAIYIAIDSDLQLPSDIRIAVRADAPNLKNWINLYLAAYVGVLNHKKIIEKYSD